MQKNDPRVSRLLEAGSSLPRAFSEGGGAEAGVDGESAEIALQRSLDTARAEGLEQARNEMAEELKQVHGALADGLRGIAKVHDAIVRDCQDSLVQLALDAASCMLRARIEAGDPVAVRALEQALAMLPAAPQMQVRLNPQDRQALEAAVADGSTVLELVEDAGISRGGCVVESEHGIVDARVDIADAELRRVTTEGSSRR